jgi:hypothetical protein
VVERFEGCLLAVGAGSGGAPFETIAKGTVIAGPGTLELEGKTQRITLGRVWTVAAAPMIGSGPVRVEFDPDTVSVTPAGEEGVLEKTRHAAKEKALRSSIEDTRELVRVVVLVDEMPAGNRSEFLHALFTRLETDDGQPYSSLMSEETSIRLETHPAAEVIDESTATAVALTTWGEESVVRRVGHQRFSGDMRGTTVELWRGHRTGVAFVSYTKPSLHPKRRMLELEAALSSALAIPVRGSRRDSTPR